MEMTGNIRAAIIERDAVMQARREAIARYGKAKDGERPRIVSEWIKPLNERLLALNRRLGL